jgi:hypothetical protein
MSVLLATLSKYGAVGASIAALLTIGILYLKVEHLSSERDAALEQMQVVSSANAAKDTLITQLKQQKAVDDVALSRYATALTASKTEQKVLLRKLEDLGKIDENRKFLDLSVPIDIKRMLNAPTSTVPGDNAP